jgi:cell shape-determining protein MreC
VFTSETEGSVFPPDLPVGKVVSYSFPQGDLEPHVTVRPVVNLDDLRYVKVLRTTNGGQNRPNPGG